MSFVRSSNNFHTNRKYICISLSSICNISPSLFEGEIITVSVREEVSWKLKAKRSNNGHSVVIQMLKWIHTKQNNTFLVELNRIFLTQKYTNYKLQMFIDIENKRCEYMMHSNSSWIWSVITTLSYRKFTVVFNTIKSSMFC